MAEQLRIEKSQLLASLSYLENSLRSSSVSEVRKIPADSEIPDCEPGMGSGETAWIYFSGACKASVDHVEKLRLMAQSKSVLNQAVISSQPKMTTTD